MTADQVGQRVVAAMNRGRALANRRDLAAAIAAFDEVLGLAPLYGTAYFDRGTARLMAGDATAAIADLERAVALLAPGTERGVAYANLAMAREELEDLAGAFRDLRQSIADGWEPAGAEVERMRGLHGDRGAAAEAEADQPDATTAMRLCEEGRASFAARPLDALARFQRAADLCPDAQPTWHGLGIVRAALRLTVAAVDAFDRALAVSPQELRLRAECLFNRGMLRSSLGAVAPALADLDACLALCRDPEVGYPDTGDREKDAAIVDGIAGRAEALRAVQKP